MKTVALLLLAACTGPASFDRAALLRATVDQTIAPTHEALRGHAAALTAATTALCADPTATHLDAARAEWRAVKVSLKQIEAWPFGPYRNVGIELAKSVDKWPGLGPNIEAALAGEEPIDDAFVEGLDYTLRLKGYPALGYLLFGELSALDARHCAYAGAVATNAQGYVEAYVAAWAPDGGGYGELLATAGAGSGAYPSEQDAITALVGGLLTATNAISQYKLGTPLGTQDGGVPQPGQVESPHAGTSVADALSVLDGIEAIYDGPSVSLSDYVQAREAAGEVDALVRQRLAEARAAVQAVPEPLETTVMDDPATVQAAIEAVDALSIALNGEVSTLLGINPSAVEGDSD